MVQTIIALITGFVGLIAALPNVQAILEASTLSDLIFDVIERVPKVKSLDSKELQLSQSIKFEHVAFKYPTAPAEKQSTLQDISFMIRARETTAIVGASGLGKSTIV